MLTQVPITERDQRLLQELHHVRADLQIIGGQCIRCLDWGGDIADQANHTVELATNSALHCLYQQKLRQLEQAWARCCSGQYGVCESCGTHIDPARLDVLPGATLCIQCQRKRD